MSAPAPEHDGRRRKGERRRRLLLDATMRLAGREGLAAVSQRAVAAEAGVAPSAVTYHFPTVEGLLLAALVAVNDEYLHLLGACAAAPDRWRALAELVASCGSGAARGSTPGTDDTVEVAAAYELFLLAGRRPELRGEYDRWTGALDALLAPLVADPARRAAAVAAVDGLFLRAWCASEPPGVDAIHAVLLALADPPG